MRALLDLRPYAFADAGGEGHWWILSDLGEVALGHALGEHHVLGIGGASRTLAGLMLHTPARRVLDLGTGCGILAMHASRFAREIVATDISERALAIARLNVELNGIEGVEFRLGSLFEPVEGEQFDRIVSNPPFVITPRSHHSPASSGCTGRSAAAEPSARTSRRASPPTTGRQAGATTSSRPPGSRSPATSPRNGTIGLETRIRR
ncbi:MAG TPA: methyltransferase [Agromyces sp.]|nr:methyltransferase [Agromyces sp.]